MARKRSADYYSPEKRQQRREAARKANAARYNREYEPEENPYWFQEENYKIALQEYVEQESISRSEKVIDNIRDTLNQVDSGLDYTWYNMVQEEIEDYDSDVLLVSDKLREIKMNDRQTLQDIFEGAVERQGSDAVALRCELHSAELLDLLNSILYDSGSDSNNTGRSGYNAKIAEFMRILQGSSMTIIDSEDLTNRSEYINEGE